MSEFTKTKGEWHIIGKSEMDGIEIGIDNKDGTKCPIANVSWYGEDDVNAEQDEATARLIAAAPDLLEACEIGLWSMRGLLEIGVKIGASNKNKRLQAKNIKQVEVAIEKATHKA